MMLVKLHSGNFEKIIKTTYNPLTGLPEPEGRDSMCTIEDPLVETGVSLSCMTFPPLFDNTEDVLDCLECLALLAGVVFFFVSNGSELFKKSNKAASVSIFFLVDPS
jgi:hypothetical protein